MEITKDIRDRLLALKEKTEKDLAEGSRLEWQRLREGVYGKRKNRTLFSEAEEDLKFLQAWAGIGLKKYLGRSVRKYRRSLLKRIVSWRGATLILVS